MKITEENLRLERAVPPDAIAGRPPRPEAGAPSIWDKARAFVADAGGEWCLVLEVPVPKHRGQLSGHVTSAFPRKRFETVTRREGAVVRAYARLKANKESAGE
jgi:FixJ family two-component response regulator